ncbi:helix-turn-helix domain-containing protein [Humidesulfovibrio idahonensis]
MKISVHYLNEREAAQFLGLSISTLQQRRFKGKLPLYAKFGKSVRYNLEDLQSFAEGCRVHCDAAS